MKTSLRIATGALLVAALLVGLGSLSVSAQGPTGTPTPGASPQSTQPAQAPVLSATGNNNLDNPAAAIAVGSSVQNVPANSAEWFKFDYLNDPTSKPFPTVTIRLLNGVQNGLNFEVWSSDRMGTNFQDNKPVGRGSQEQLINCTATLPDGTTARCTTNDLVWSGAFGAPSTYFVRITNSTNNAVAPQMVITGSGLPQCAGVSSNQTAANNTTLNTNQSSNQTTMNNSTTNNQGTTPNQAQNQTSQSNTQAFVTIQCNYLGGMPTQTQSQGK